MRLLPRALIVRAPLLVQAIVVPKPNGGAVALHGAPNWKVVGEHIKLSTELLEVFAGPPVDINLPACARTLGFHDLPSAGGCVRHKQILFFSLQCLTCRNRI